MNLKEELKTKSYEEITRRINRISTEDLVRLYDSTFLYYPSEREEVRKKEEFQSILKQRLGF